MIKLNTTTFLGHMPKINKNGPSSEVLKYKSVFENSHIADCVMKAFIVKKVKKTVPWLYIIEDANINLLKSYLLD